MPRLGEFKNYPVKLTGLMDTRSNTDELPPGFFRLNKNISARSTGRVCRLPGWVAFLDEGNCADTGRDNSDLHDQLVRMAVGYQTYEFTIPGTSQVSSQIYPYQFPNQVTEGSYTQQDYSATYGGYAPTAPISWSENFRFRNPARSFVDSIFIRDFFVGYPYYHQGGWSGTVSDATYRITDLPYETSYSHPYSTGNPWYYVQSHYYASFVDWTDGQFVAGYPYGTPTNIYTSTPSTTYEYCSTQAYYRDYCDTYFSGKQGREAITLLYEFSSGGGIRKLVAATQSRIYALNGRAHNWRILADGLGGNDTCECGTRRFHVAQLGNTLVFTNDFDLVLYWSFDSSDQDCELQSVFPIEDLLELEVHKASVVVEYKGFIFLMNVELGGTRHVAKAIWSDYAAPLSYLPANDSLAGDMDIGNVSEAIIEAKVLGDYLFIFKERSVWRLALVDPDDGLFSVQQVYRGESTPRFRNTVTSTGDEIFYFGPDTIYKFDLFSQSPKELDWMHRAAGMIFDENLVFSSENLAGGIEHAACDQAVGGWDPTRRQLWFSWVARKTSSTTSVAETTQSGFNPAHGVDCPNRSMMFNMRYTTASYVDHGFSAFAGFRPDNRPALKDWLAELCVCDINSWTDEAELKQGAPCYNDLAVSCPDPNPPASLEADICSWWKADSFNLADGTAVGGTGLEWQDQKSANRDLVQSTPSARPLFKTNIFGSKPAIRFDGINDTLVFSPDYTFTSGVSEFTLVMVYKHNSAADGMLFGFQGLSFQMLSRASVNAMRAYDLGILYDSSTMSSSPSSARVVAMRNKPFSPNQMFRENKTNIGPLSQSNIGFRWDTMGSTNGALFANIDVAEAFVFCKSLTDSQLNELYDYFKIKYPVLPQI